MKNYKLQIINYKLSREAASLRTTESVLKTDPLKKKKNIEKNYRFFHLLFGCLFFILTPFANAEKASDNPLHLPSCQLAWSAAFDQATEQMTDIELPLLLQQNTVAGADLWASYRRFSLRYECLLRAVCGVAINGKADDDFLGHTNALGGIVPGDFYECPSEEYAEKSVAEITFQEYLASAKIDTAKLRKSCSKADEQTEIGQDPEKTTRSPRLERERFCTEDRIAAVKVFDTLLERMIWKDVNRKRIGFVFKKITELRKRINNIRDYTERLINGANDFFKNICTISQSD